MNNSHSDWNSLGLIAYANNLSINIIDSYSMKIKQTLENGKYPITRVKWSKVNGLNRPLIKLASADETGNITIWDTYSNQIINEFKESNTSINDFKWKFLSNNKEILAVLYSPNKIVIWDPSLGVKLINKTFNESIYQFALNHTDDRVAIYFSNGSIEYYANFFEKHTNLIEKRSINDSLVEVSKQKCIQFEFNSVLNNLLIAVYPKEFLTFDLCISKQISHVKIEKNSSPFVQIYSCSMKDILYLLHENGCVSIYKKQENQLRKQVSKNEESLENIFNKLEVNYDYNLLYQSDPIRLAKSSRVLGFSVCPTTQKHLSILINDGRLFKYEILKKHSNIKNKTKLNEISTLSQDFLIDLFDDEKSQIKMVLESCNFGQSEFNTNVIKMFNPLKGETVQPLLAVGGSSGLITYNFEKNIIDRKLSIFNNNNSLINGIEWVTSNSLILWSSPLNESITFQSNDSNSQTVRNEIVLIDLRTGEFNKIRDNTSVDESPITSIKLSNLKQYLIILFKDQPFEIWDIRSFTLIKRVSKRSPPIKILEWFSNDSSNLIKPSESVNTLPKDQYSLQIEYFICLDITGLMYSFSAENGTLKDSGKLIYLPDEGTLSNLTAIAPKKEYLIFGDSDGNLNKWNIKTKSLNLLASKLGNIKQLKFSNKTDNLILLITLVDSVLIFDVAKSLIISSFKVNSKIEIVYSDWYFIDKIIVKLSNNIIKILNMELKQVHDDYVEISSLSSYRIFSTNTDYLMTLNQNKKFLYKFVYSLCNQDVLIIKNLTDLKQVIREASSDKLVKDCMEFINPNLLNLIKSKLIKYASHDLVVKQFNLLANLTMYLNLSSFEVSFWSLLAYFNNENKKDKTAYFDLIQKHSCMLDQNDLSINKFETLKLFRDKHNSNQDLVHKLILCDKKDHAFNVLIETNTSNDSEYLNNSFKAALIASFKTTNLDSDAKTSIKLIATNLIANGKVVEGVEILCLIGLVLDACRYLQDNNDWEKAALLAKFRLPEIEYISIIKRWCDHLVSISQIEFSILLLISCKQYIEALKFLNRTNYKEVAYFYLDILTKNNLVNVNKDGNESNNQIDEKLSTKIVKYYDN